MKAPAILGAASISLIALTACQPGAESAEGCDRACLTGVLNTYLDSVAAGDTEAAPLAEGYRETENQLDVAAGEGLWATMSGLGEVQRRYIDTINGSAAYFGTIAEDSGDAAVVTLRIKVEGEAVSEAEWIVARPGEALYNPAMLAAEPPPEGAIAEELRTHRAALEAAADSYFQGLAQGDGSLVINQPGCVRLENGTRVTQRGQPANADPEHANEFADNDCASGLDRFDIRDVAHRRFPVIDEEAGVAVGYGVFLRNEGSTRPRLLLSEVFTTENGQITGIYAAMHYLPAEAPDGMGW